jgi:MFS family permease
MPLPHQPPAEQGYTERQVRLGLTTIFAIYVVTSFFVQTIMIARPRMAADLNGMSLYSWSISIPSLAAAFVMLLFSKFSDMYGRRIMLMISLALFLIGSVLSALSPTFPILIAANTVSRIGSGGLFPLCYAVLGDMFEPSERSKWVGLLNIPLGFFALFGPTLGGWFVDNLSWRHLYWMGVPLLAVCILLIPTGIPSTVKKAGARIDVRGAILVAIASSATILGFSFAGTTYPWGSVQIIGLLAAALLFWVIFFWTEGRADEPIMDPQVFRNRTFLTVAIAGMMSFFGLTAMMMYFPIFLQGIKGVSVMQSGMLLTPYNVLMAFLGVPTGFILAKTKKYKSLYIMSYGIVTVVLTGITFFSANTPTYMAVITATLVGIGLGAIPTINTLVVQWAVPKRLLGVSLGTIFFSITMGMAIAPAILGPVNDVSYARSLEKTLPAELNQIADKAMFKSLGDPKALLSPTAMKALEQTFNRSGDNGKRLFPQTIQAIRTSMVAGVRSVFIVGAIGMLIAFLLILTVPEVSMDAVVEDKKTPQPAAAKVTA